MILRVALISLVVGAVILPVGALAQTSSIGAAKRRVAPPRPTTRPSREAPAVERNVIYEQYAWSAVAAKPRKAFRPNDLITIIIREHRRWEADSELELGKRLNLDTQLDAFFKLTEGGVGAALFRRGKPNVNYKLQQRLTSDAEAEREDTLTTRLAARIIDVKPNGLLVLEAKGRIQHDEEISNITLTGTCRKEDVSPDNTVLSTQIADKNIVITNKGALKSAATRGWVSKLLDWLKPF